MRGWVNRLVNVWTLFALQAFCRVNGAVQVSVFSEMIDWPGQNLENNLKNKSDIGLMHASAFGGCNPLSNSEQTVLYTFFSTGQSFRNLREWKDKCFVKKTRFSRDSSNSKTLHLTEKNFKEKNEAYKKMKNRFSFHFCELWMIEGHILFQSS